ncbi:MAG: hypothetical protein LBT46_00200 [Planctomycetaceae bacterium]|jgi:hypothetical protein|nr:hypothetical protein [Planctomycetaceae bacterium]
MIHTVRFEVEEKQVSSIEKMSMFCFAIGYDFILWAEAYHIYVQDNPGGCFVATASCGSECSRDVVVLTKFRDNFLRKSFFGRCFIALYETVAPPIAQWLKKGIRRRLFVKKYFISPIAYFIARWF